MSLTGALARHESSSCSSAVVAAAPVVDGTAREIEKLVELMDTNNDGKVPLLLVPLTVASMQFCVCRWIAQSSKQQ